MIAADACTNSKERGALVTTLAFTLRGGPAMATLLLFLAPLIEFVRRLAATKVESAGADQRDPRSA